MACDFYRASYASAVLAVIGCLYVRLSVTSRSCTKMAKPRITLRMAYDSPGTLVFRCEKSRRNSNDITPNGGTKWRWGRFESGDLHHITSLPLRRSTAATLYSSAMTDASDAFKVAERYRPTAINNVRSKSITGVVYINSRCASTVPSALAELLVRSGVLKFHKLLYPLT